jgi:hypothetical protein
MEVLRNIDGFTDGLNFIGEFQRVWGDFNVIY